MTEITVSPETQPYEGVPGVPHPPGTAVSEVTVTHPSSGESSTIFVPADHDGSRIKVEFPDGAVTYIDGFDPAARAVSGKQFTVPCDSCGRPQVLSGGNGFICSACGTKNVIEVRASTDAALASSSEG